MAVEDYISACKAGKKEYQIRMMKKEQPTLLVLDEILPSNAIFSEVELGLVQIPIEQIVGTKTGGRSSAFARNYMPVLKENTEFAQKWIRLSNSHMEEGIREPVKAYEYMNRFYVQEGNKRVSVLKYFGAVSVPGTVTRIIPKRTEEKENKIYFEFLDFYKASQINYIWFTKEGCFAKLQKIMEKKPGEMWSEDEKLDFSSLYTRFCGEYEENGGRKLSITPGDAFLSFLTLYGKKAVADMTSNDLKKLIIKSWEEFELLQESEEIHLKMDPSTEKKPLLNRLFPISTPKQKIGFLYAKTPASSGWTYAHELGRLHLEQKFSGEISTVAYQNVTMDNAQEYLNQAVKEGCTIIFTTSPSFVSASVKAAIDYPQVKILNCSLNTSHRYIRTYYARMHEAKFLMGAIAGAMAENDRLTYAEDYPIYGSIANINAFALGAKMINPRAQVYLEWTSKKDYNLGEVVHLTGSRVVSGKDMLTPEDASRAFGIYLLDENGEARNLAMPLWNWGIFYERMLRTILAGAWKNDDDRGIRAINYWWGMSAGVVDVIISKNLPIGTKRLVDLLKKTIMTGEFNPFAGVIYAQNERMIQGNPDGSLTPEQVAKMDWLAENVIGDIPVPEQLKDQAKPVISEQGIKKEG